MPLNIDLHTHSFFSGDGISSPEDMIAAARAKGLSGIAITDHNTCDAVNYLLEKGLMRLDGMPVNDFLVLPGVEVTTADGHLLCIGAELPYLKGKPAREVCDIIHVISPVPAAQSSSRPDDVPPNSNASVRRCWKLKFAPDARSLNWRL